ncbi:MAG: tandem-95 repeat protein [Actinomycetales bacterium]|nr:tandem-95 repeat protein [Actinomycetales bacterium]
MASGKRRHASLLVTLLLIAGGLVTAKVFSNAVASAPPTPRDPVVLWSDNFENFPQPGSAPNGGQDGVAPMALNYGGVKYTNATGTTYTGDSQWLNITGCNGIVLSWQAPNAAWPNANGCENASNSLLNLRKMAQAVGSVNGTGTATNHIVAAYTNRGFNTAGVEAQTEQPIAFSSVAANRYFTASVWATAMNCSAVKPRLVFEYSTDGTTWTPFGSTYIDPCSLTNVANQTNFPGINVAKGYANSGIMLPVSSTQMYLRVKNVQTNTGGGNDGGWDDLTLYEATPAISKEFSPTSIDKAANPSAYSTLTFTVTNTTDKSAKAGWEITDTLPTGLTIASSTTGGTCTPKTFTDGSGGSLGSGDTSVKIVGTIPYNVASCTVTVQVTGSSDGTFTNILDPTNPNYSASSVKGLLPEGSASLTITGATPSTVALTYDCTSGTGSTAGTTAAPGTSVTVAAGTGCTKQGATFLGWSTSPNGSGTLVNPGDPLTLNANTTLYAVWSPPSATNDTYTTPYNTPLTVPANTGVLANDSGSGITRTSNTQPPNGTVTMNPDGSFTYTPNPGFSGQDCWNYTITEAGQNPATATAQSCVTVGSPAPSAPVASNDTYTTPYQTPKVVPANAGVLANDTGTGITVTSNTQPPNGTVAMNPDGSYTYTPDPGFSGQDCWNYTITDNASQTATAQSCVTVAPPGAPTASNDSYTTPYQTPKTVPANAGLLANDTGTQITVTSNTQPPNGTVTVNQDGSFTYTPNPGFSGQDCWNYTITDNASQTATAQSCVTVGSPTPPAPAPAPPAPAPADPSTPAPAPAPPAPVTPAQAPPGPVAVDDAATTMMNTPVSVNAAANDTYPAGSVFTQTSSPANGTVAWNANGSYTYTPNPGFTGVDTFTYKVCMPAPNQARCASATERITVGEPEPKAAPQNLKVGPGSTRPLTYRPVGLSTPATGSNLKPGSVAIAQYGTGRWRNRLVVPGKGTWILKGTQVQFVPAAGFTGQTTIRYRIQDRNGKWAFSTLTASAPAIPTDITGGVF